MIDKASLFPLLLSTIAGLSTVLGAVIIFFSKTRNEKFLTFSLGFSAGVMITVSFTDLFPTAQEAISKYHGKVNGILWSILFLLIGALMAYLIDIFIPEEEKGTVPKCNNNFDIFRVGLVSTIALMIHNFPEERKYAYLLHESSATMLDPHYLTHRFRDRLHFSASGCRISFGII